MKYKKIFNIQYKPCSRGIVPFDVPYQVYAESMTAAIAKVEAWIKEEGRTDLVIQGITGGQGGILE